MSPDLAEPAKSLRWSTRRSLAADTLWASGKRLEALRLAKAALGHALDAAELQRPDSVEIEQLRALGLSERQARRVQTAADRATLRLPVIEADLEDAHARLFPLWREACRSIERVLADRAEAPARLAKLKRLSAVAYGVGALGLLGLLLWNVLLWPESVEIRATGYRVVDVVETWPPENVYDRDEMTYWHLPPGETGSIELRFEAPRDISAVRILNAHDRHVDDNNRRDRRRYDQASRQIVVRAFAGNRLLAEAEAELPRVRNYERVTVPLAASGMDRLEVEIVTFYGVGGGLAEIELLP